MAPEIINGIPVVDIGVFTQLDQADPSARERVAQEFATKCRSNGCIGVTGHGISAARLAEMFTLTKRLFDLPLEDKMKAPHPPGHTPHRGYSGLGREQGAAKTATETDSTKKQQEYKKTTDHKESYEIGSDDNSVQYNVWLPDDVLPNFRADALAFFWELSRLADQILDCIALSLRLDEKEVEELKALHRGHDDQLRLLHYPSIPSEQIERQAFSRHGAHKDWSLFTLLFQSDRGGLEFLDRSTDKFMSAAPTDDIVYLNIGDMLMRLSNGYFPSAMHRVTVDVSGLPDKPNDEGLMIPARYSIPFFVIPTDDGRIAPLQSLSERQGCTNFEPITFGDFSTKMFNIINVR